MKEVLVVFRDDYDKTVTEDVETREFSFDGVDYEVDLSENNFENMRLDIKKWLDVARKAKRRKRKVTKAAEPVEVSGMRRAPSEAEKLPPDERKLVRAWRQQQGHPVRSGKLSNAAVLDWINAGKPKVSDAR